MCEAIVDEAGGGGVKAEEGVAGEGTCLTFLFSYPFSIFHKGWQGKVLASHFYFSSFNFSHKGWLGQR